MSVGEMLPETVARWLQEQGYGLLQSVQPVGGGCINNGARLITSSGRTFFLKTHISAPAGMFEREVEGLDALRVGDGPRVPEAYLHGRNFLLLEDLTPAARRPGYWTDFGRRLAALHKHTNSHFGFPHDNYIGLTPQPNQWTEDGYRFFGEHRLLYQAHKAEQNGYFNSADLNRVERLATRLPGLIPSQTASLLHGDLWSGNALTDANGSPALIDPAAHYGWAEAELAMTALFGGFPGIFYDAYNEAHPLEKGYRERFSLYNLYHLMNHLNLFGEGYLGEIRAALRLWVG